MDYKRIYDQLCDRAKARSIVDYTERHHVVPRCLGGSDCVDNLVKLTAREHFLAHLLLRKIHPDSLGLVYAVWMMSSKETVRLNSKSFAKLREQVIELQRAKTISAEHKESLRLHATGRKVAQETKDKIGISNSGKKRTPEMIETYKAARVSRVISAETREKMNASKRGKSHSEEHKSKIRSACTGKIQSEETRNKKRAALLAFYSKQKEI